MLTTPTPLAETIRRTCTRLPEQHPLTDDIEVLLSCARRCEAMARVSGKLADLRLMADSGMGIIPGSTVLDLIDLYEDAASERDALAKRVEELEHMLESQTFTLSTDPGLWPEAQMMIVCEHCGNKRCPHAEDKRFICSNSNELGQVGVLAAPIADPTQGVGQPLLDRHLGANRPTCVPPGAQWDFLPSGLACWVGDASVRFEASESYAVLQWMLRVDYEDLPTKYRAHIDKPDFLAARALGVRVLGWGA